MGAVSLHVGSPRLGLALGRWPGLLLHAGVLLAVVGGRGFVLARVLGGRYPIAYLLYDVVAFGTMIAGLRLFDRLVRRAVECWMDDVTLRRRLAAGLLHAASVVAVACPGILVTLQLDPLRIAPGSPPRAGRLPSGDAGFAPDDLRFPGSHIPATRERFVLPAVTAHQLG